MILSRLVDSKVKCIDAYYLTTAGSTAFSNIFSKGFYSSFRKFAGKCRMCRARQAVCQASISQRRSSLEFVIKWTYAFRLTRI